MTVGGSLPRATREKAEVRIKMEEGSEPDLPRERPVGATRLTLPFSVSASQLSICQIGAIRGQDDAFHRCFSICVEPFQNLFGQRLLDLVVSWNCFYNSILRIHPD
jgi:hypothetical protein